MSNLLKKHGFSISVARIFTRPGIETYDQIHFQIPDHAGDKEYPALEAPEDWGAGTIALFAEDAVQSVIPAQRKAIEENTVPSFLWRHRAQGKSTTSERSVKDIFDRVAGGAAHAGWKQRLFFDESQARYFFDEARYALAQRFIAFDTSILRIAGVEWAYGFKPAASPRKKPKSAAIELTNSAIDSLVSGSRDKALRGKWQKALTPKTVKPVSFRFTDISSDWCAASEQHPAASIDLLSMRHNDGTLNAECLVHATRLLVLLHDLNDVSAPLNITLANLSPLLMALALPYDSETGRSLAASICALVTAEAYIISAELAALRGPCPEFTANRDAVMRSLRNHRRAVYGDHNDFEKVSVLPASLSVKHAPDLPLVASVQRHWDQVLIYVRQFGLRHIQVTSLGTSSRLTLLMQSATQGIEPLQDLLTRQGDGENLRTSTASFVSEALGRLNYTQTQRQALSDSIAGTLTLDKAPRINHASLKAQGFGADELEKIEDYLPAVRNICLVFTPWILGEAFYRKLNISAAQTKSPHFDLLKHLGFTGDDIVAASAYCYGTGDLTDAKMLNAAHKSIFACRNNISAEAKIRMAASVQGFVSGDVETRITLSGDRTIEAGEKLVLGAWRQGVKTLTLTYGTARSQSASKKKNRTSVAAFLHTRPRTNLPARKVSMKAAPRMVSLKAGIALKTTAKNRNK